MTVNDLYQHFLSAAHWVDRSRTADQIEAGDPTKTIARIGTGWSACVPNLRAAAEDGCDLYITHEPSFCEFWRPTGGFRESKWGQMRMAILEESGMALMSMHDCWDVWPTHGIRDSWMSFLGLDNPVAFRKSREDNPHEFHPGLSMHEIDETTLDEFAMFIGGQAKAVGACGLTVMGEGDALVRSVAVGVGAWIPTFEMHELGADVLVQIFDAAYQTFVRLPLLDLGANIIVLEHGIVEMPGMQNMARYLADTFPELSTGFYNHEPKSRVIAL